MTAPRVSEVVLRGDRLYHLGVAPGEVATRVFLVGDPARAHRVAEHFEAIEHTVSHREYLTITGVHRGLRMSVIGTGMGTDNVEICLIELHAAHALDLATGLPASQQPRLDILRIGTSGGVQEDVPPETLCIAEYALGLDSTGPYYEAPPADERVLEIEAQAQELLAQAALDGRFRDRLPVYASKADVEVHRTLLKHAGQGSVSGITVSAPGFYGPSSRFIEKLSNTVPDIKGTLAKLSIGPLRVVNMEMESSLLFHLAACLGHRAGTICPVISQPNDPEAVVDYERAIGNAIRVALDTMVELAADLKSR